MSGNDSSAIAQKAYKVGLKDGKIAIEGIDGFSIDVEDPKLNVGKLYSALFADVNEPTTITLEPAIELKQDRKASSFFESLKKIVELMPCCSLAKAKADEGLHGNYCLR